MLTDVFEKALNAGFIQATDYVEIWQAFLDYLRRRVNFSKGESSCLVKTVCLSAKKEPDLKCPFLVVLFCPHRIQSRVRGVTGRFLPIARLHETGC